MKSISSKNHMLKDFFQVSSFVWMFFSFLLEEFLWRTKVYIQKEDKLETLVTLHSDFALDKKKSRV